MNDMLDDLTTEVVVAGIMWLLSLAIPFRSMRAPREFRLDVLAVLCAAVFSLVAAFVLAVILGYLEPLFAGLKGRIERWPPAAVDADEPSGLDYVASRWRLLLGLRPQHRPLPEAGP